MKVKIFACHHKQPRSLINSDLFADIVSGLRSDDGSFLTDMDGDNIWERNEFAELRHHYFVWKNLLPEYDYVGFEHYRRRFFINPWPFTKLEAFSQHLADQAGAFDCDQKLHELQQNLINFDKHLDMRRGFDEVDTTLIKSWLSRYEVAVPRMWHIHDRPSLEAEWKNSGLPPNMWDVMIEAASRQSAFQPMPRHPIRTSNHGNIFIMRSEFFNEYMEAFMNCIEDMAVLMRGKIGDFPRQWGYVGEKLINFFILAKRKKSPLLSVVPIPLIVRTLADDVN